MKSRILTAAIFFLGAYFPLALIIFIQDIDYSQIDINSFTISNFLFLAGKSIKNIYISVPFLLACGACLLITLFRVPNIRAKNRIRIVSSKPLSIEVISYTIPYVVSFSFLNLNDFSDILSFLIFFIIMFLLVYKVGNGLMNPLLIIFGWKLYEVEYQFLSSQENNFSRVLCRDDVLKGKQYYSIPIDQFLLLKSGDNDGIGR